MNNKTETPDRDNLRLGEKGFLSAWISKFLFSLISVKVWGLVAGTIVSTYLALKGKTPETAGIINGAQWVTFNTTVWALIFGMKEVFRIASGREKGELSMITKQSEANEKIKRLELDANSPTSRLTSEGLEIVGVEPE